MRALLVIGVVLGLGGCPEKEQPGAKLAGEFQAACRTMCEKQAACAGQPAASAGCIGACPRAAKDTTARQIFVEAAKACGGVDCDKLAECSKDVQGRLLKGKGP